MLLYAWIGPAQIDGLVQVSLLNEWKHLQTQSAKLVIKHAAPLVWNHLTVRQFIQKAQ